MIFRSTMSLSDESVSLITGFLGRGVIFVIPARVDLLQPVGSSVEYDKFTPNCIADRTSRTTET